ncbi:restriction endonuclease subunit S [Helicobacter pylori]|nr:restriction endonuclease subunit S [Helicobacter pylori]
MDALMLPLPKDWEIKTFRDISTINQGLQIPISQRLKAPTEHAKFYITIQALNNRKEFEYIKTYNESVVCHKDDILMTRTGNTGMVITNIEGVFHNNFFKINFDRTLINKDFLVYFLSLEQTQKTILRKAGTSTIPDLNHNDFYSLSIPLPPLNEQSAIANILSALDRYLYALDALILKKEGVKKALSFELLSQRKRLKGFNQAWQRVRLGDIILSLKTGLNPRKFFKLNTPNANNYYVTVRELEEYTIKFTHQTDRIDDNALSLCLKRSNLEKDDVLFSGTGTIGKVSIIKENPNNWAIKEGIYSIKPNKKIVFPRFLMFCFENLNIQNDIKSKSSEGIVKSISMNDLQQITIPLPPLNEQNAIANILSALDNEITSLKNKKHQFENIKKALNHDLMSAKIRVLKK